MSLLTPTQAVRQECAWCLKIPKGGRGYDCLCPNCTFYASMPWRGQDLPKHLQPEGGTLPEELRRTEEYLKTIPPRRPTKGMIARYCRQCKVEGDGDCTIDDCTIWPYRPFQPGGPPRRRLSRKQLAANRVSIEKARAARGRSRMEVAVP